MKRAQQLRSCAIGVSSLFHNIRDVPSHRCSRMDPDRSLERSPAVRETAIHKPSIQDILVGFPLLAPKDLEYKARFRPGDFRVETGKRSAESLRFPDNTNGSNIAQH